MAQSRLTFTNAANLAPPKARSPPAASDAPAIVEGFALAANNRNPPR
jgi:hypothetical protein